VRPSAAFSGVGSQGAAHKIIALHAPVTPLLVSDNFLTPFLNGYSVDLARWGEGLHLLAMLSSGMRSGIARRFWQVTKVLRDPLYVFARAGLTERGKKESTVMAFDLTPPDPKLLQRDACI